MAGLLLGILFVQLGPALPPLAALAAMLGLSVIARRWQGAQRGIFGALVLLAIGFAVGAGYTTIRAQWRLADFLAPTYEGQTVTLNGHVSGLPERVSDGVRFTFVPDPSEADAVRLPKRLALSWYPSRRAPAAVPGFGPGQRMRLSVRLRRHVSQFNPGGFDYAGWQFARGVGGGGSVRGGELLPERVDTLQTAIDRWRDSIRHGISAAAPAQAGLLTAIAVGDQSGVSDAQWETLRATGTAHLVAISGLHVSIVAALAAALLSVLWRRVPRAALWLPTQRAAVIGAALAGLGYGALAGFGVPVTRAVIMLLVAAIAVFSARRVAAGDVLALALGGVLIFDPWAVVSGGFWLSFGAVAALLLVLAGRHGPMGSAAKFLRAQWGVTLLGAPLLLTWFGQISLVAPIANALAIPVVTMAVVPPVLVASVTGLAWPAALAGTVVDWLLTALDVMAAWPWAMASRAQAPLALVVLALAGMVWLLLPRGTPLRLAGAMLALPLALWTPARPLAGAFEATVLDVGQGLAIHIRTHAHDLLYDTGRAYYRGNDAGARIVVPYLRARGIAALDMLVVSHSDNDHAGGAGSVLAALPVTRFIAGEGVEMSARGVDAPCLAGTTWTWDGVRFAWLHPRRGDAATRDNNRSCVLHISAEGGSMLIPGDIEARVEGEIAERGDWPKSEVVVAPHHGSRSSSSAALIDAVAADAVVFSAGYGNHFGHPAPDVVERWQRAGSRIWRTDSEGAVSFQIDGNGVRARGHRAETRRYWHPGD